VKEPYPDCLKNISLFKGIDQIQLGHIKGKATLHSYVRGSILFVEGQETNGTYIVLSGLIKVVKIHKEGREKTVAILGRGDILGEMTLFETTTRSATAKIMEDSSVLLIPNSDFKQLLLDIPQLALQVIGILAERLRQTDQHIQELLFFNARERIVCNLLHLAAVHGIEESNKIKIPLRLTHAELANLVGVSRETVTKVLDDLRKDNLIRIKNRQLWLLNKEELFQQVT
jgi:CRP/FNR family transcriptional regulator